MKKEKVKMKKYTTPDFVIEIEQVTDVIMISAFESDPYGFNDNPFTKGLGE
jgi:hypothetical protein